MPLPLPAFSLRLRLEGWPISHKLKGTPCPEATVQPTHQSKPPCRSAPPLPRAAGGGALHRSCGSQGPGRLTCSLQKGGPMVEWECACKERDKRARTWGWGWGVGGEVPGNGQQSIVCTCDPDSSILCCSSSHNAVIAAATKVRCVQRCDLAGHILNTTGPGMAVSGSAGGGTLGQKGQMQVCV